MVRISELQAWLGVHVLQYTFLYSVSLSVVRFSTSPKKAGFRGLQNDSFPVLTPQRLSLFLPMGPLKTRYLQIWEKNLSTRLQNWLCSAQTSTWWYHLILAQGAKKFSQNSEFTHGWPHTKRQNANPPRQNDISRYNDHPRRSAWPLGSCCQRTAKSSHWLQPRSVETAAMQLRSRKRVEYVESNNEMLLLHKYEWHFFLESHGLLLVSVVNSAWF